MRSLVLLFVSAVYALCFWLYSQEQSTLTLGLPEGGPGVEASGSPEATAILPTVVGVVTVRETTPVRKPAVPKGRPVYSKPIFCGVRMHSQKAGATRKQGQQTLKQAQRKLGQYLDRKAREKIRASVPTYYTVSMPNRKARRKGMVNQTTVKDSMGQFLAELEASIKKLEEEVRNAKASERAFLRKQAIANRVKVKAPAITQTQPKRARGLIPVTMNGCSFEIQMQAVVLPVLVSFLDLGLMTVLFSLGICALGAVRGWHKADPAVKVDVSESFPSAFDEGDGVAYTDPAVAVNEKESENWNGSLKKAWVVVFAGQFASNREKAEAWETMTAKEKLNAVNRYINAYLKKYSSDEYSELMHNMHDISELLEEMVRAGFEDESAYLTHVSEEEAAREAAYWAAHPEEFIASEEAKLRFLNMAVEDAEDEEFTYFSTVDLKMVTVKKKDIIPYDNEQGLDKVALNAEWVDDDTYFEQGPRWVGSDEPPMTQAEKRRLQDMQAGYDTSWEDGSRYEADFYWDLDEPNSYEEFYAEIQVDTTEGEEDRWNDGDDVIPKDSMEAAEDLWDRMETQAIEEAASSDFRVVFWEISWAWVAIYFGPRVPGEVYHSLQGPHCPSYPYYQPSQELSAEAHEAISRQTEVEAALDSILEQRAPSIKEVAYMLYCIEQAYSQQKLIADTIRCYHENALGYDFESAYSRFDEVDAIIEKHEAQIKKLGFQDYEAAKWWYKNNTTEKERSAFRFAFTYGYDEDSLDNPANCEDEDAYLAKMNEQNASSLNPNNWSEAERQEAEHQQKLHEIEVLRNTTSWYDEEDYEPRGDFSVEFNGFHSPYCGKDVPAEAYISLDAREPAHPLDIRNIFGVVPEPEEIQFNWAMILPVFSIVLDGGIAFSLGLIALGAMVSINLIKQLPKRNPSVHINMTEEEWLKLCLDSAKSIMRKMRYEEWVSYQGLKVIDQLCLQTYMAERMPDSFADLLHFIESGKVDWSKVTLRCASERELDEWWDSLDEEEQVFFLLTNPCESSKPNGVERGVWVQVPVTTAAGFCDRSDKSISFTFILPVLSILLEGSMFSSFAAVLFALSFFGLAAIKAKKVKKAPKESTTEVLPQAESAPASAAEVKVEVPMAAKNEVRENILAKLGTQYLVQIKDRLDEVPELGEFPTVETFKARAMAIEALIQGAGHKEYVSEEALNEAMVFDPSVTEEHANVNRRLMKHIKSTYRGVSMAFIDRFPKAAICIQARAYMRMALNSMLHSKEVRLTENQLAMIGFAYSIQMSTTTVEAAAVGKVPILLKPSERGPGLYKTVVRARPYGDSNACSSPEWVKADDCHVGKLPKKDKDNKRTGKYMSASLSKLLSQDECAIPLDLDEGNSWCNQWSAVHNGWESAYLFPLSKVPIFKTLEIEPWNIGADFIGRSDQHFWLPMVTKMNEMKQIKQEIDKLLGLKRGDNISAAKTLKYFGQLMSPNQLGGNLVNLNKTHKIKIGKGKAPAEVVIDANKAFVMMNQVKGLETAGDDAYDGTIYMSRELMALCLPTAYQADVMAGKYDYIVVISRFYTNGYFLKGGAQCLPPGMLPHGVHILSYGKKTNLAPIQGSAEFLGVINSGHPKLLKGAATDTQTLLNEMDWNCKQSVAYMKGMMTDALTYLKYVMAKVSESYSPGSLSPEEADKIASNLHMFLEAREKGEEFDAEESLEEVKQVSQLKEVITAIQRIMSGAFAMPQMIPAIFNQMTNESMDPGRTRVPLYRYMVNPENGEMEYMPIAYSIYLQAHPGLALMKLAEAKGGLLTEEQKEFYMSAVEDVEFTRTAFLDNTPRTTQDGVIFCSWTTYRGIVARMKSNYMFFSRSPNTFSSGAWGQLVPLDGMRDGIFWIRPTKEAFQRFMSNSDGADFDDRFVGTMGEFAELQIRFHEGAKKALITGNGSNICIDTFRKSPARTKMLGKFLRQSIAPMMNADKASYYGALVDWNTKTPEAINAQVKQLLLQFCPTSKEKKLKEILESKESVQISTGGFKKLLENYGWPRYYFQKGQTQECDSCMDHLKSTVEQLHALSGSTGTAANAQMDAAATLQGVKVFEHFDLDQPAPFLDEEGNVKYLKPPELNGGAITFRDIYKFIVSEMLSNVIDADTQGQNVVEAIEVMENLYMASFYLGAHIFLKMETAEVKLSGEKAYFNSTMRRGVKVKTSPFLLKRPIGLLGDMTRNVYDVIVNRSELNWDRLERPKLCIQLGEAHEIFKAFEEYRDAVIALANAYVHQSLNEKRWAGLRSGVDSLAAAKGELGDYSTQEFKTVTHKRSEEIDKAMSAAGSLDKKARLRLRKAAEDTWLREVWGKLSKSRKEAYAIWTLKNWINESDRGYNDLNKKINPKTSFVKVSDRSFGSIAGDGLHTGTAYMGNILDNDGNIVEIGPWMYFIQALNAAGKLASKAGDVDETLITYFSHDRFGVYHPERADEEHKKAHFNSLNNQKNSPAVRVPFADWLKASGEELIGKVAAPVAVYDPTYREYVWEQNIQLGIERLLIGKKLKDILTDGFSLGYLIMYSTDSPQYSTNKQYFDIVRAAGFVKGKDGELAERAALHDEFVSNLPDYTIIGVSPLVGRGTTQYAHPQFQLTVRRPGNKDIYGNLEIKDCDWIDGSREAQHGYEGEDTVVLDGDASIETDEYSSSPGSYEQAESGYEAADVPVAEAEPAQEAYPKVLSIVGTAGRDKTKPMNIGTYRFMLNQAQRVIKETGAEALMSGGAAWADHVAVTLFLAGKVESLTLYLPAPFENGKFVEKPNGDSAGKTANHYHRLFTQKISVDKPGFDSLADIAEALSRPGCSFEVAKHNQTSSFFERNTWVAEDCDAILAFTWGKDGVDDGGTKDTWNKYMKSHEAPEAYHISLTLTE